MDTHKFLLEWAPADLLAAHFYECPWYVLSSVVVVVAALVVVVVAALVALVPHVSTRETGEMDPQIH